MAAKSSPKHYYMVAAVLTYVREDMPKQRHLNAVTELPRKAISVSAINNTRIAMFQRLTDEAGIQVNDIKDIVFLSFTYLGHMAPEDFYDMQDPPASVRPH